MKMNENDKIDICHHNLCKLAAMLLRFFNVNKQTNSSVVHYFCLFTTVSFFFN